MIDKNLNRIKVVLAEKNINGKVIAEKIGVGQSTFSKWVTNTTQPSLKNCICVECLVGRFGQNATRE